jgi:hypothetical protein
VPMVKQFTGDLANVRRAVVMLAERFCMHVPPPLRGAEYCNFGPLQCAPQLAIRSKGRPDGEKQPFRGTCEALRSQLCRSFDSCCVLHPVLCRKRERGNKRPAHAAGSIPSRAACTICISWVKIRPANSHSLKRAVRACHRSSIVSTQDVSKPPVEII